MKGEKYIIICNKSSSMGIQKEFPVGSLVEICSKQPSLYVNVNYYWVRGQELDVVKVSDLTPVERELYCMLYPDLEI